jgi:hypothetical protein
MAPSNNESIGQLACRDCGILKAASQFRRRSSASDVRINQCRACHALAERLRRCGKRSRTQRQAVNRQLAKLKRAKSAHQVAAVCEAMVRGFGGPDGFATAWQAILRRDLERGGFAALRHLEATLRLIQHCEGNRPDYSQFSEQELLAMASAAESALL